VEAESTADDQHAFIAQRGEQAADLKVERRAHAGVHRELDDWHILLGCQNMHDAERPVIEAALIVEAGRNVARGQQVSDARGKRG